MSATVSTEIRELLKIARERVAAQNVAEKRGFVDPAAAAGAAGGMPPGGAPPADPMAGAMPPMPGMGADPAAMGGDPAAMGGDPAAMGMGADPAAGLTEERVMQMIQEAGAGGSGGAGGTGEVGPDGQPKPKKVDVNTEIYHVKKLLVYLLENLGLDVPPTMLLGDPAEDPQSTPEQISGDPASAGASPQSAIAPIQALQGASQSLASGGGAEAGGGGEAPKVAADQGLLALAGEAAAKLRIMRANNG